MVINKWSLCVTKKSKVMVFGGGRLDSGVQFTYKGFKLEMVINFRYLGVQILLFRFMCGHPNYKNGQKAVMAILNRAHVLGSLAIDIKCRLFNVLVAPILMYDCEVWGTKCYNSLKKSLIGKLVLGVPSLATLYVVLVELGRFPL